MELVELLSALELPVEPPAAKTPGAPTKYLIDSLSDEVFFALSFDDVRRNDDARDEAIVSNKSEIRVSIRVVMRPVKWCGLKALRGRGAM